MVGPRSIVIKSPQELEAMREAGRINAEALAAVREIIRPGVTTADLDEAAETVIRKYGAKPAFLGVMGAYRERRDGARYSRQAYVERRRYRLSRLWNDFRRICG